MAGFFTRLANRLFRAERHARTLAHTLHALVEQAERSGEQHKELVNIQTPLLPGRDKGPFVEFSLFKRSLLDKSKQLAALFAGEWGKHVKDYLVTASIPQPNGKRELYFLAAYDAPWSELTPSNLREGIIEGVAVGFHEDLETAMRHLARSLQRQ